MSQQAGHNVPLSGLRKLVIDHQHFSGMVPGATVERQLSLGTLQMARQACLPRPSWCAIFLKAMGMVSARYPQLRRAFLPYPRPHLYEHPITIGNFTIERHFQNEDAVFYVQVRRPELRTVAEINELIHLCKDEPVESNKFFRRAIRLSKAPKLFRRMAWWFCLNWNGKLKAHNFGTFGISSTSSEGAGITTLLTLVTSTLHYGLFDNRGNLPVRITFDHRVLDGAFVSRCLVDLEEVLQTTIRQELLNTHEFRAKAA